MISIVLRERGPTPRFMAKALRVAKKVAYREAGLWWHRECRPKHFEREAYQRYGYVRRMGESGTNTKIFKRSYTGRKLKKFGHTKPLVWSGVSERLTRVQDVRATNTGVRVVMPAFALNFRPKNGRIFMRREVENVTHGEAMQVARIIDRVIDQQLDAFQETLTRTL